jgi:hypothetical protein
MYDVTAKSEDKKCILEITNGVKGLDRFERALGRITMFEAQEPVAPPEGKYIVGKSYDIGPDGSTFEPVITLKMSYGSESISENVSEKEMYIAYWDGSEWQACESMVDVEGKTVSAQITHFTQFTIIGGPPSPAPSEPAPVPPQPSVITRPPNFVVSGLSITPNEVTTGEEVTVSVVITNTGGSRGSYTVVLTIDGVEEATKEISLGVNESKTMTLPITKDTEGIYEASIGDEAGQFTVTKEEVIEEEQSIEKIPAAILEKERSEVPSVRWIIGGIIGGFVMVAGLIAYVVIRRRRTA